MANDGAALVLSLAYGIDIAIRRSQGTTKAGVGNGAPGWGVKCVPVGVLVMDALYYVDFATAGPSSRYRGFCPTAVGSVLSGWYIYCDSEDTYNAGQVPQIPPGMWARSKMMREPDEYCFLLVMRTLSLPAFLETNVWSAPIYVCPFAEAKRPLTRAAASD